MLVTPTTGGKERERHEGVVACDGAMSLPVALMGPSPDLPEEGKSEEPEPIQRSLAPLSPASRRVWQPISPNAPLLRLSRALPPPPGTSPLAPTGKATFSRGVRRRLLSTADAEGCRAGGAEAGAAAGKAASAVPSASAAAFAMQRWRCNRSGHHLNPFEAASPPLSMPAFWRGVALLACATACNSPAADVPTRCVWGALAAANVEAWNALAKVTALPPPLT